MANSALARPRRSSHSDAALRRSFAAAALAILAVITSAEASAQTDKEKAASDKLYQEGLSKMLDGKLDVGCPKLAESQRLFPRPGTLFTLAECEAKAGRSATAIDHYKEYLKLFSGMDPAAQAKQRDKQRDKISTSQIDALTLEAPRITIVVVGEASKLTVKLDGAVVESARFGSEILVDPGEHVVGAEGGRGGPFERRLSLQKQARERVEVRGAKPRKVDDGSSKRSAGPSGRRVAAFVIGGAGVASVAVGAITGILALGEKDKVTAHCKDTRKNDVWSCDAAGLSAADSGKTFALVSSTTIGVGAGAAAAGLVLFLTEPSAKKKKSKDDVSGGYWLKPQVVIGPSSGFAGVTGAW